MSPFNMFKAHMKMTVHKSSTEANFRSKPQQRRKLQMTRGERNLRYVVLCCLLELMEVLQNKDSERKSFP